MRFLASYILAGRVQAIGVVSALLGLSLILPPVGLLSSAAVALVTLRLGGAEGLTVIGVSALLSALLGGLFVGSPASFAVYGAALWAPAWIVARVLRERVDLASALETGVAVAATVVVGIYAFTDTPSDLWRGSLEIMLRPLLENPPPGFSVEQLRQRLDWLAQYMTGVAAAGSLLGVTASLFLARWWQAQLFNPGGFGQEYLALRGHRPLAFGTVALLVMALASQGALAEAAGNLLAVALAFYVVAGVALLHSLCTGLAAKRFLLVVLYGALLVIPHVLAPVALAGLADAWFNLRRWGRAASA